MALNQVDNIGTCLPNIYTCKSLSLIGHRSHMVRVGEKPLYDFSVFKYWKYPNDITEGNGERLVSKYYSMKCFTFWENIITISILDMKNYGFILNTCHDTGKRAETRVGFPVIFSWLRWPIEPKLSQVWYFMSCDTQSVESVGLWTILFTESVKWLKSGRWFELHSTKQWKSHHNQGACPICSSELWKIGLFSGNFLQNQGELAALSHSSYQVTGQQLVYRLNYKIWDFFYKALYQLNYPNDGDGTLPILSIFLHGDINQRPFPL